MDSLDENNITKRKKMKVKHIPWHIQKRCTANLSQSSFNKTLAKEVYKGKVVNLMRSNKTLAFALQNLKLEVAAKEMIAVEAGKHVNTINNARFKLKDMLKSIDKQKSLLFSLQSTMDSTLKELTDYISAPSQKSDGFVPREKRELRNKFLSLSIEPTINEESEGSPMKRMKSKAGNCSKRKTKKQSTKATKGKSVSRPSKKKAQDNSSSSSKEIAENPVSPNDMPTVTVTDSFQVVLDEVSRAFAECSSTHKPMTTGDTSNSCAQETKQNQLTTVQAANFHKYNTRNRRRKSRKRQMESENDSNSEDIYEEEVVEKGFAVGNDENKLTTSEEVNEDQNVLNSFPEDDSGSLKEVLDKVSGVQTVCGTGDSDSLKKEVEKEKDIPKCLVSIDEINKPDKKNVINKKCDREKKKVVTSGDSKNGCTSSKKASKTSEVNLICTIADDDIRNGMPLSTELVGVKQSSHVDKAPALNKSPTSSTKNSKLPSKRVPLNCESKDIEQIDEIGLISKNTLKEQNFAMNTVGDSNSLERKEVKEKDIPKCILSQVSIDKIKNNKMNKKCDREKKKVVTSGNSENSGISTKKASRTSEVNLICTLAGNDIRKGLPLSNKLVDAKHSCNVDKAPALNKPPTTSTKNCKRVPLYRESKNTEEIDSIGLLSENALNEQIFTMSSVGDSNSLERELKENGIPKRRLSQVSIDEINKPDKINGTIKESYLEKKNVITVGYSKNGSISSKKISKTPEVDIICTISDDDGIRNVLTLSNELAGVTESPRHVDKASVLNKLSTAFSKNGKLFSKRVPLYYESEEIEVIDSNARNSESALKEQNYKYSKNRDTKAFNYCDKLSENKYVVSAEVHHSPEMHNSTSIQSVALKQPSVILKDCMKSKVVLDSYHYKDSLKENSENNDKEMIASGNLLPSTDELNRIEKDSQNEQPVSVVTKRKRRAGSVKSYKEPDIRGKMRRIDNVV